MHVLAQETSPLLNKRRSFFFFFSQRYASAAETILGKHSTLEVKSIHLGGLFHAEEEIQMTSTMPNFIGQMQGFVYNGQRYGEVQILTFIAIHEQNGLKPTQINLENVSIVF